MTADNSQEVVYVAADRYQYLILYLGDAGRKPEYDELAGTFKPAGTIFVGILQPWWTQRPGAPLPGEMRDFEEWMLELGIWKIIEKTIRRYHAADSDNI